LKTFNYTPGTATPADYTTPGMKNYRSSQKLIDALFEFEKREGLNGAFILIHPGTEKSRSDKLYNRLPEIIERLRALGYEFERL
jgi:peptidoglycan/xylan/chitin deacetylase (PgdA/CDA1 family)